MSEHKNLSKKKKVIQPLHADDPDLQKAHDDMLRELQKRTAELASKVHGTDSNQPRVLELDTQSDEQRVEALQLTDDLPKPTTTDSKRNPSDNPAADVVRAKLDKLFSEEPDATTQAAEAVVIKPTNRSKHQEFMYQLTTSGKPLAEVQTEWHNYYIALPDAEKHDVWREFYENQSAMSAFTSQAHERAQHSNSAASKPSKTRGKDPTRDASHAHASAVSQRDISSRIKNKVNAGGRLSTKDHLKSLAVGLGLAFTVFVIFMFTFFNQAIIAPFISPSRNVSATPILDPNAEISDEPRVIIPKINVDVPVVYDVGSIEEKAIQDALEQGVVHYATTPRPGENGNGVIVGHSSNNILNSGKYKFAFVLLRKLEIGDTFYLHYEGVRYTYKVYEKRVVPPTDVSVLGPASRDNTFTLITCDPPGTSTNRLIVIGEQVSPDPVNNEAAVIDLDEIEGGNEEIVPGNAPSFWSRIWPF